MSISTTGNHPAYSVDVEDSTIRDKFVSEQQQDDCTDDQMSREKRIVLLFVSYENGLVSLINTKVNRPFRKYRYYITYTV